MSEHIIQHLPIEQVHPNIDNPRAGLGDLTELAATITEVGILEPLIVTPEEQGLGDDKYVDFTIVAGHRRHAAALIAGLDAVPCIIRTLTDEEVAEIMCIENLQRADLTPYEEGLAYGRLVALDYSQAEIARRVGRSQPVVSKRLALLRLPQAAIELLQAERIQVRQAEELAALPEADLTIVMAEIAGHTNRNDDEPLPTWVIPAAINKAVEAHKRAKAEQDGLNSGLPRTDTRPSEYSSNAPLPCKRKEATCWYVGNGDTKVTWATERPARPPVDINDPSTVNNRNATYEEHQAARRIIAQACNRIQDQANSVAYAALRDAKMRRALIVATTIAAVERLTHPRGQEWHAKLKMNPLRFDDETEKTQVLADPELYLALVLLFDLTQSHDWTLNPTLLTFFTGVGHMVGPGEVLPEGFVDELNCDLDVIVDQQPGYDNFEEDLEDHELGYDDDEVTIPLEDHEHLINLPDDATQQRRNAQAQWNTNNVDRLNKLPWPTYDDNATDTVVTFIQTTISKIDTLHHVAAVTANKAILDAANQRLADLS